MWWAACDGTTDEQCSADETLHHVPIHDRYTRGIDIQQTNVSGTQQEITCSKRTIIVLVVVTVVVAVVD